MLSKLCEISKLKRVIFEQCCFQMQTSLTMCSRYGNQLAKDSTKYEKVISKVLAKHDSIRYTDAGQTHGPHGSTHQWP